MTLYDNMTPCPNAQTVQPALSTKEDVLDMAYINSLPQPFIGREIGGWEWPINDFEVATGMLRIDVCGLLQVKTIVDFISFLDADGVWHPAEGFYADATMDERRTIAQPVQPATENLRQDLEYVEQGLRLIQFEKRLAAWENQEPVAWVFLPHNELLWPNEVEAKNPLELDSFSPLYTKPKEAT